MPAKEKCVLVESLYQALKEAGLFTIENDENLEDIAKLVNTFGHELLQQNIKLEKEDQKEAATNAIRAAEVSFFTWLFIPPTIFSIERLYLLKASGLLAGQISEWRIKVQKLKIDECPFKVSKL